MTPPTGYTEHDVQRWRAAETDHAGDPFVCDRARVLRSAAWRTLGGKTQCLDAAEAPAVRVRLTHSLEVADIARAIGTPLGADPLLLETAGLAHDLGHPPFGHNGERALNELAQPCGGFEANAQSMRILSRLEPGTHAAGGLNLTRAALDAACKYPWRRRPGLAKFGAYHDDLPALMWVREQSPPRRPCLEAQITDWADDIANATGDIEDALRAGLITPAQLASRSERAAVADLAAHRMTTQPQAAVEHAAADLMNLPPMTALLAGHDGTTPARAALQHLSDQLIATFTQAAVTETRRQYDGDSLTRYRAELCVPGWARAQVAWLKALILRHVIHEPARRQRRNRQRELLAELFGSTLHRAPATLDPAFAHSWTTTDDDAARVRVVIDQLASLTETEALTRHQLGRQQACPATAG
ncbi:deoxyguanosinetriphosphate triphosphohydrolase [Streptomyces javensis]|uniref:deoxyguanosinetriphosphate triphosphohydrolase n=1 Tax=Streptomyces javensis TaxID=114698 RepID=UPI002812024E|nr:deoxyguanosinetriphosphate triphosphohydrolase [Streptomyces javensis]